MAQGQADAAPTSADAELRAQWGWSVALGIALLVLGFIAFGNLVVATVVSVLYVGVLMVIGAVAQIIHAVGIILD